MPQVSVVIPTCNRAEFLSTAIGSVLNQSFQDFEILVVDDGSSDGTAELLQELDNPKIRSFRHDTPRGGAAARNTGILHCNGDYVAFLDDDDKWYPKKLACQMEVMRKSQPEVAAVYTGYVIIDRVSRKVCGRMIPSLRGNLYPKLLESNPIGGTSSVLLKRVCLEKVGLFDESLPSFQDRDLWIRISREFQFDCIADVLLNYFVHPNKVWTNLDALMRGLEIMLKKYGSSAAFKKQCSARYLEFGVRLCETNQNAKGRKALLRSVALYPYRIQPYAYYSLSLLGWRAFVRARETKATVCARLGVHNP